MISIMKESNHPKKRRSGRDFLRRGIILLIWILIWQGISMIADNALLVAFPYGKPEGFVWAFVGKGFLA